MMIQIVRVEILADLKTYKTFVRNHLGLDAFNFKNSRFELKDIIQQIIGATIFVSPFIIIGELTHISNKSETSQRVIL